MYAIATLLIPPAEQAVRSLWTRFEETCGLAGVRVMPLPHFSWVGADTYQEGPIEQALEQLARCTSPFVVHTAGLGIFTGPQPVVYISLVKDEPLLNLHKLLWEQTLPCAVAPNMYYHPSRWVPHITLALREGDPARLGCAVSDIAFQRIDLEIVVDHFSVIYLNDGNAGQQSRFSFGTGFRSMGSSL